MRRHQIAAALAGALVTLPLQAAPGDIPEKRLFGKYDKYQAAPQPAPAATTSTAPTKTASTPPTRTHTTESHTTKLSPGNERIAYAIAKGALAEQGIKNPTQEQIKTALNGGTVTTKSGERITMPGVLKLREKGMGWGLIAQKHGFKLGEVMGRGHDKHHKHADRHHRGKHHHDWKHHARHDDWKHHKHGDWKHDKHERADWKHHKHERADWKHHKHGDWKHHKHERADWKHHRPEFHRAKYERPEKFQRPEKFERPHKHERPERPEKHHRSR